MPRLGPLASVFRQGGVRIARATILSGTGTIGDAARVFARLRLLNRDITRAMAGEVFRRAAASIRAGSHLARLAFEQSHTLRDVPINRDIFFGNESPARMLYQARVEGRDPSGALTDARTFYVPSDGPMSQAELWDVVMNRARFGTGSDRIGIPGGLGPDDLVLSLVPISIERGF